MSIKKYYTFAEAEKDLWVLHPDEKYYLRLKLLYDFWSRISKKTITKGIHKFDSVEDLGRKQNDKLEIRNDKKVDSSLRSE